MHQKSVKKKSSVLIGHNILNCMYFVYNQKISALNMHLSRAMRKPAFCICENKDADQLRGNRVADQRLYFHYLDSSIPLLPKSEISKL